jgi:hypothetical protein
MANPYINGYTGNGRGYFKSDCENTAVTLRTAATITAGVIRWNSNNAVPPADIVEFAAWLGLPVDVAASNAARDADTSAFLTEYRKVNRNRKPSAEERFEMRAAHGPGKVIVDVITGQKFRT